MKDLKFASKDIITSLRETIWALKKDNYTAEDCLLRIKNFIQPFARYYPHIKFTVEGEAPAEKESTLYQGAECCADSTGSSYQCHKTCNARPI